MMFGSLLIVVGWVRFGFEAEPLPCLRLGLVSVSLCHGHWAERMIDAGRAEAQARREREEMGQ